MMKTANKASMGYFAANALILVGFLLLVQPFTHFLFTWGFPILLIGVLIYLVLDHLPARFHNEVANKPKEDSYDKGSKENSE